MTEAPCSSPSTPVLQGRGWPQVSPSLPGASLAFPWLGCTLPWLRSASRAPSCASAVSLVLLGVHGRTAVLPAPRFLLQLSDRSGVLEAEALRPDGSSGLCAGGGHVSVLGSSPPDCAFRAKNVRISCSMLSSLSTELLSPSEQEGTSWGYRSGLVGGDLVPPSRGPGRIVLEMSRIASAHISSADVSARHGDPSTDLLSAAV